MGKLSETIKFGWQKFLAVTRISKKAVCEMSKGKGEVDYHDWRDGDRGPWHFGLHHCNRCGKSFII